MAASSSSPLVDAATSSPAATSWWEEEVEKAWAELDLPTWGSVVHHATDSWRHLVAFVEAVDWNEPWLLGLAAFHVGLLVTAILTRKSFNVQTALWTLVLGLVAAAQLINEWAMANWRTFAGRPYFTSNGFFVSLVFSFPLLLIAVLITINFLVQSCETMAKLKAAQLRQKRREEQKKTQ